MKNKYLMFYLVLFCKFEQFYKSFINYIITKELCQKLK